MKSPGWQHCASAWAMSVETRQRIHMAIICTSIPAWACWAPMKRPGWQHCASAWAMSVETGQRIHVAIKCTSIPA